MARTETDIEGILLDETLTVSFTELTSLCGATGRVVKLMVTEGLLQPEGQQPDDWRFSGLEVRRARRALRLRRDLDLNLAGVALALDLLDELETLRERLRCLEPPPDRARDD
ncbi:chaperone modulator CbpM [Thiocystis violacea]|uniref:chaperone modulator CbpM n=1 Tax=Thiocystis violacea TaxID=13725 RepID=UPI0019050431|nr:chaperone modulator CbpM [Thiocystis violacea]MBK1718002.1 MerR family transcriptional regulator [Thiocystis violacea]